jgi:hypothetical protein
MSDSGNYSTTNLSWGALISERCRQAHVTSRKKPRTSISSRKTSVEGNKSKPAKSSAPKSKSRKVVPPDSNPDELVKIVAKEGGTKFAQMRKLLDRANVADKPADILGSYLDNISTTQLPTSPGPRSPRSPQLRDFHTGLTPTSGSRRRSVSPELSLRRDSDEGFAASDLLLESYSGNKIGTFLHGQRGANLRNKQKTLKTPLQPESSKQVFLEDIPDMERRLADHGKEQLRRRVLLNTAEDEHEEAQAGKENNNSLIEDDVHF